MKRTILHINILLILFALTSFDSEKIYRTISNTYDLSEIESNSMIVTRTDNKGNSNYYNYNKEGLLTKIDYNEKSYKSFSYNNNGQLIKSELTINNEIVDRELISYHDSKIVKVDFNSVNGKLEENYKEEYSLNTFNQVISIQSFNKKDNNWHETNSSIKLNWNLDKVENIEVKGFNISEFNISEKLDFFTNIEANGKSNSKSQLLEVTYSNSNNFNPNYLNLFDINSLLQNNTSTYYISYWNNGKRKESVKYKLYKDSYPLKLEVSITKDKLPTTKYNYFIEMI